MGFVGFLDFVLKCIQLLAWPSFALGYPLCASIRAIETNSDFHMRKLVAYWIFFSLISLFEYAFSKLLEWVPVWPYVKILAIFWLVIPGFNGASIAYDNIVRPCLSMNLPQIIVDMLNEKRYESLTRESFLEEAEKYVKENGTEALEKLFASKTIINEPPVAQEDIKPVEILHKSTEAAENKDTSGPALLSGYSRRQKARAEKQQTIINEPPVAQEDIKPVEILHKSTEAAENKDTSGPALLSGYSRRQKARAEKQQTIINEPPVAQEDIKPVEILHKSTEAAENKDTSGPALLSGYSRRQKARAEKQQTIINEPPVAQEDIKPVEILHKSTEAAENKDTSGPALLSGYSRRQKARAEKQQIATTVDADIKGNNAKLPEKLTENAFLVPPAFKNVQKEWTCAVCQVTTQSEASLNSHLEGMKHRTKCEELKAGKQTATKKGVSTGTPKKERNCAISQVTTQSKTTWISPHQEFIEGKQTAIKNNSSSTTIKSEQPNHDLKKVSSDSGKNKASCANQNPKKSSSGSGPNNKFDCDLCQVKLQSEATLKSHLKGTKHKSKSEQLKARETTEKDKITTSAKYSDKNSSGLNKNLSAIAMVNIEANVSNGFHLCSICNVTCTSECDMAFHLRGNRHLSESYWRNICDVNCLSEIDMASHLNGKTHDSNLYESD